MAKASKQKTESKVISQNVEADLKFNKEQREDGKSRQIVVKDKFFEFQSDHEESQESKESPLTVELTLLTIIQDLDTRKITRKEAFKPLKTFHGGINGV